MENGSDVPSGLDVCHSCDNKICVRPDHLWIGTRKQNIHDARDKGLLWSPKLRGSKHGRSILTEHIILEIREEYAAGGVSHAKLAERYSVSESTIQKALNGSNWSHVRRAA
jgi:ribosome-binding protein aMBF1 (putative translation factor)